MKKKEVKKAKKAEKAGKVEEPIDDKTGQDQLSALDNIDQSLSAQLKKGEEAKKDAKYIKNHPDITGMFSD